MEFLQLSMTYEALALYATGNKDRSSHLFKDVVSKIEEENYGRTCLKALNNLACSHYAEGKFHLSKNLLLQGLQALLYGGRYSKKEDSLSTMTALLYMTRRQVISPIIANETKADENKVDVLVTLLCNLATVSAKLHKFDDARECLLPLLELFNNVHEMRNHPVRSTVMRTDAELLVTLEKKDEAIMSYENLLNLLEINIKERSSFARMASEEEVIAVIDALRNLYKDQQEAAAAVRLLRRKINHQRALLKLRIAATAKM